MNGFATDREFCDFVRSCIFRLNEAGHSRAALQLSDGFRLLNGLTDGAADFLEVVQKVESEFAQLLSPQEREALERIRTAIDAAVYRR